MEIPMILDQLESFKKELMERSIFSESEKKELLNQYAKKLFDTTGLPSKMQVSESAIPIKQHNNSVGTFASLINKSKISQHTDYVIFATYYLIIQQGLQSVTVKDILLEYKSAYIKPSNTGVFFKLLVQKGFLMVSGKKEGMNAFSITKDGIEYVGNLLNAQQ